MRLLAPDGTVRVRLPAPEGMRALGATTLFSTNSGAVCPNLIRPPYRTVGERYPFGSSADLEHGYEHTVPNAAHIPTDHPGRLPTRRFFNAKGKRWKHRGWLAHIVQRQQGWVHSRLWIGRPLPEHAVHSVHAWKNFIEFHS